MKQLTIDDAVVYVSVRMPATLKNRCVAHADTNDWSLNRAIVKLIDEALRGRE